MSNNWRHNAAELDDEKQKKARIEMILKSHDAAMGLSFGVAFCLFLFVLGIYAGLIPIGHWHDEYFTFMLIRDGGLGAEIERLHWSPRPLSEALVYLYSVSVFFFHEQLIGSGLTTAWAMLAAGIVGIPLYLSRRAPGPQRGIVLLLALAIFALFLMGHPTAEMFYWPIAALAYLPAISAIGALYWLALITGLESRSSRICGAVLLVIAACSVEIGAMLIVIHVGVIAAYLIASRTTGRTPALPLAWLVVPTLIAIGVLIQIYIGRVTAGAAQELMGSSTIAHNIWPSIRLAAIQFLKEVAGTDQAVRFSARLLLAPAAKLLLLIAIVGLVRSLVFLRANKGAPLWLGILGVTCMTSAFLTVAAAYFQFGTLCCERHETFRQCLIYIGLISGASAFGMWRPAEQPQKPTKYVWALIVAVTIPLGQSAKWLKSDYSRYALMRQAQAENWNSGSGSDSSMSFRVVQPGKVVGGVAPADGTYRKDDPALGWWVQAVLGFFRKNDVTFRSTNDER
jgi:hypothetical protein